MAAKRPKEKSKDNYRKQADYWKRECELARQQLRVKNGNIAEAQLQAEAVSRLVQKQDEEIARQKEQIQRMVDERRDSRSKLERSLEAENTELRNQLKSLFRKRNEANDSFERASKSLEHSRDNVRELHHYLEDMSVWFAGSAIVAIVSLIVNAVQWYHR